jgi:hypothetical protein
MPVTMWNNTAARAQVARQFTSALGALDTYGDDIWDTMCFLGAGDADEFTTQDVVERVAKHNGLTQRTAYSYVTAFMMYARLASHEFSGPKSRLQRVRRGVWRLDDAPDSADYET